ncbi:MAG: sialidase family protein [Candidatus Thermoplasmatota archaeon]
MARRILALIVCFLLSSIAVTSTENSTSSQSSVREVSFENGKPLIKDEFVRVNVESTAIKTSENREILAENIMLTSSSSNFKSKAAVNNYQSPAILVAPNNWYHAVFENWTGSEWDIIYARSTDEGATWAYATLGRADNQRNPRIAFTSDWKFHIVSEDPQYFVIWQSSNNGSSWSAAGYSGTEWWADARYPSLASNGSWLYAVVEYWDGTDWYIRVRYSSDSGSGWSTFTINVADGRHPSVALNSARAMVAFQKGHPTSTYLYIWQADLGSTSGVADQLSGDNRDPYLSTFWKLRISCMDSALERN